MKTIINQNQTYFGNLQRILIASIIIAKTMQVVSPKSASPRKAKMKNTGAKRPTI